MSSFDHSDQQFAGMAGEGLSDMSVANNPLAAGSEDQLQYKFRTTSTADDSDDEVFEDAAEEMSDFAANGHDFAIMRPAYQFGDASSQFGNDFGMANAEGVTDMTADDEGSDNQHQHPQAILENYYTSADLGTDFPGVDPIQQDLGLRNTLETDRLESVNGDTEGSIFKQAFVKHAGHEEDISEMEEVSGNAFDEVFEIEGAALDNTVNSGVEKRRLSTPPPPVGIKSEEAREALKKAASVGYKDQRFSKEDGRLRQGPDVDRDRSRSLNAHFRFHERVAHLIPRLPNQEFFDWERRYWIAVLIEGKKPKNATSEKDFIWMKGNKFSTVATVFHSYANATMADKDELVLLLGNESVDMVDQMQQLDYFSDRLVVMKAMLKSDPDSKGKSIVEEIEPVQIDLTDD